jgi:hypothetical protein
MTRTVLALFLSSLVTAAQGGQPVVRVSFQPTGTVVVGQQVKLTVQVLVPNYFLKAPDWPTLDIDGAVVTMSDEVLPNLVETIDGVSYAGVQRVYLITPQQEGEFPLPPVRIAFQFAAVPGQPPADGEVTLPPERFSANLPEGARTDTGFLPVARLTVHQTVEPPAKSLKAGDAITRTITVVAEHTQPMMIPPPTFDAPDGVRVYRKDPTLTSDTGTHGELLAGHRVDRATYLFEKPGQYTLPAVQFPWFDVSSNTRKDATAPAITVDVAANDAAAPAIAPEPPPTVQAPPPPSPWVIWRQRLPWILGALAVLLAAGWLIRQVWPRYRHWSAARRKARAESEVAAFEAFQMACDRNDRTQVYASLTRWAIRAGQASLTDWCGALGHEPFTTQVRTLEASLFSAARSDAAGWSGASLKRAALAARSAWLSQQHVSEARKRALPRLNPRWLP